MFTLWAKKAKENPSKVNKKVENQPIMYYFSLPHYYFEIISKKYVHQIKYIRYTLPIAKILSVKNARAWVSMQWFHI